MSFTWKRKLSSRKFWATIISFIGMIAVIFGIPDMTTERITAVVASFAVLIIYVIGESIADAKNTNEDYKDQPIDWKRKLSSRKFWATLISFITTLLIAIGCKEITIEKVTALITAISSISIYILAESFVDGSDNNDNEITSEELLGDLALKKAEEAIELLESNEEIIKSSSESEIKSDTTNID